MKDLRFLRNDTTSAASYPSLIQPIRVVIRTRGTGPTRLDWTASLLFLEMSRGSSQCQRWYEGGTRPRGGKKSYLVIFTNLPHQIGKGLIHINPLFSRCLDKATTEMLCEITTLCVCVMEGVSDAVPAAVRDFDEEGRIRYHSCRLGARIRGRTCLRRR